MSTHEDSPQDDEPQADEPPAPPGDAPTKPLGDDPGGAGRPRRLYRRRDERVLGGVCSGVARYADIDPVIVRVVAVAATFFGGVGILLYLAALLLVPDEQGHVAADPSSLRGKLLIGVAGVLLFVAVAAALPWGWGSWFLGGLLFPLAFLALLGVGIWWLVQGGTARPGDTAGILRSILLALLLLSGCALLAIGSAWAAAVGGEVIAVLVVATGLLLAAGAFVGHVRWLILPALAVALPLGIVSAAKIEVDASLGQREYRPASAGELRDRYELGVGDMMIDLRYADLPPRDYLLRVKLGVGRAVLLVDESTCVASAADVGIGGVRVFDHDSVGADLEWDESRDAAPGSPRVLVTADIGIGALEVDHERHDEWTRGSFRDGRSESTGCEGDRA